MMALLVPNIASSGPSIEHPLLGEIGESLIHLSLLERVSPHERRNDIPPTYTVRQIINKLSTMFFIKYIHTFIITSLSIHEIFAFIHKNSSMSFSMNLMFFYFCSILQLLTSKYHFSGFFFQISLLLSIRTSN